MSLVFDVRAVKQGMSSPTKNNVVMARHEVGRYCAGDIHQSILRNVQVTDRSLLFVSNNKKKTPH